ncbi:hypothetical protein PR048_017140 [Dryococelus australis]|uniref:Uncharacterized protein n=1 Tax=Dryococelus australis TaxID=614101 RepID=A0ABQ9H8R1_9NEOP|nr:hypothetical protein PR048_017140 [Dryococelus australis]
MVELYVFNVKNYENVTKFRPIPVKKPSRNTETVYGWKDDTHKIPYDRVKRCWERKKKNQASERVNVDVFTQNKRLSPQHSQTFWFNYTINGAPSMFTYENISHPRRGRNDTLKPPIQLKKTAFSDCCILKLTSRTRVKLRQEPSHRYAEAPREHCTLVQSPARRGDGTLVARVSVYPYRSRTSRPKKEKNDASRQAGLLSLELRLKRSHGGRASKTAPEYYAIIIAKMSMAINHYNRPAVFGGGHLASARAKLGTKRRRRTSVLGVNGREGVKPGDQLIRYLESCPAPLVPTRDALPVGILSGDESTAVPIHSAGIPPRKFSRLMQGDELEQCIFSQRNRATRERFDWRGDFPFVLDVYELHSQKAPRPTDTSRYLCTTDLFILGHDAASREYRVSTRSVSKCLAQAILLSRQTLRVLLLAFPHRYLHLQGCQQNSAVDLYAPRDVSESTLVKFLSGAGNWGSGTYQHPLTTGNVRPLFKTLIMAASPYGGWRQGQDWSG